jgi:L-amino acid N-acyltransferase YncA
MLKRSCYVGVAEVGIYVSPLIRGCGVERALLDAPIESSETHGVWTLQATTIAENVPCLKLQKYCGL